MMAKKRKPTQLDLDMIQCEKDGYGCHYGAWKAAQAAQKPVKVEKEIPDGWQVCKWCGKPFKPTSKKRQIYCEIYCQQSAQRERDKEKMAEHKKAWREKQAADAK